MRNAAAQRHRINRVINFAHSHLAEPIDLDVLADVACLSKFHFTRVFSSLRNETPINFLYRVRLERAARKLSHMPRRSITDIAFDCGFSNSQSFSHAFQNYYGISPRAFRLENLWTYDAFEQRNPFRHAIYKPSASIPDIENGRLPVIVAQRPAYRVAYIRHFGPYGDVDSSISSTFAKLQGWAATNGLAADDTAHIGVCLNNAIITPARHCIYDACMVVPDRIFEDDTVSIQVIPADTYAVLSARCRPDQLFSLWQWLLSYWLPKSGYVNSRPPSYEFFPATPHMLVTPENGVKLCLPVSTV